VARGYNRRIEAQVREISTMKAGRSGAFLLCGILTIGLAGCEKRADESADRADLVAAFPSRIGSASKVTSLDMESERPGTGSLIQYAGPDLGVSVYVYDSQVEKIPSGAGSPIVRKEFEDVIEVIHLSKEIGLIQSVKEVSQETVFLDPGKKSQEVLSASFQITKDGESLVTRLFLTGYGNHFLKLRVTYEPAEREKAEAALGEFLVDLATFLEEYAE
jgi:hypothetical protein